MHIHANPADRIYGAYLMGCQSGDTVHMQDIERGVKRLYQTKKYRHITITLQKVKEGNAYDVHIIPSVMHHVAGVYVYGILLGREHLANLYAMKRGEAFVEKMHIASLHRIKHFLVKKGYLDVTVRPHVVQDEGDTSVTVFLHVDLGKRYRVRDVAVELVLPQQLEEKRNTYEFQRFERRVQSCAKKILEGEWAENSVQKRAEDTLAQFCLRQGFLCSKVTIQPRVVSQACAAQARVKIVTAAHRKFDFFGNHFFTDESLRDIIFTYEYALDLLPPSLLAQEIKKHYHAKGFWEVEVEWEEESDRYLFCIVEGQRASVQEVKLHGVHYFSSSFFNKTIRSLIRHRYVNEDLLEQAKTHAILSYFSQGFWDIAIVDHSWTLLDQHKHVYRLDVFLEEGMQRKLAQVTYDEKLERMLEGVVLNGVAKEGSAPFDGAIIRQQRRWLQQELIRQGYIYAIPQPQLLKEGSATQLVWHVAGNTKPVYFGKTIVQGLCTVPYQKIVDIVAYTEHEKWDEKKLQETTQRLHKLGIFEQVAVQKGSLVNTGSMQDVVVDLVEASPFEVRIRGGVQYLGRDVRSIQGISPAIGSTFVWRNPTGNLDKVHCVADISYRQRNIIGYYDRTFFTSHPCNMTMQLYSTRFDQPVVYGFCERLFRLGRDGVLGALSADVGRWHAGMSMGCEWSSVTKLSEQLATKLHFLPVGYGEKKPHFFGELTTFSSWVDDALYPRVGGSCMASAKAVTALTSFSTLLKVLVEGTWFVPLHEKVVCALRLKGGHIFGVPLEEVPPSERFYLGGAYSVRSYRADLVPPTTFVTCAAQTLHVPIGAQTMAQGSVELRCTLTKSWQGVVFSDYGYLAAHFSSGNVEHTAGALGAGVRYLTPIGPIRFDVGWKWKKEPDDCHPFAWFLTIDHAF